ncbi:MAG: DinB family protein [Bacillota bacterium]|nr:DinB family protein [Bacillota bacterium]
MSEAKQLLEYHFWATNKLLQYINDNCPEVFTREIASVFNSIKETAEHLYIVDTLWFDRIRGIEADQTNVSFESAKKALKETKELQQRLIDYLKSEDLTRIGTYKNSIGTIFENTVEEICIHLANHGTYHRGNITAMLWSMGYKSTSTDYIYFLREKNKLS